MKRKNIFLVIAIMAVLALVGCSGKKETSGGSVTSDGNFEIQLAQAGGGDQSGTGWPPANILSRYGIAGMSAPSGVTGLMYRVYENFGEVILEILFKGTSSTRDTLITWFTDNDWVTDGLNDLSTVNWYKGDYRASWYAMNDGNYVISFYAD